MRIGYFEHWSRPTWSFMDFLREQGYDVEKIDYSRKNYLEQYDVALIEQNGFNDYIENDELYIRDWVGRGGICLFMHQDYQRWAPCFLPHELGYTQLIHRYVPTINGEGPDAEPYMCYMMPWPEGDGKQLFNIPEKITVDEMLDWKIQVHTFNILRKQKDSAETVRSAALSCFLANPAWDVLGTYMDPAVRDGALILQGKYGKGMYFLNQILVPEILDKGAERCLAFWKKYMRNLIACFENFKAGIRPAIASAGSLAAGRRNYKLAIHMHSLDWYGCDSAPGTIHAMMRYKNYDICALSVKDAAPYNGKLDPAKYSDDKVLFLDGQEYHPFNWNDRYDRISHNNYHILAVGTDHDAYTQEFTRSLFSDEEIDGYLHRALTYIREHNGASVATHPWCPYWYDYPFDAVDMEPLRTLEGSDVERYWLSGRRIGMMVSVDLFGFRRIIDNPAANFIYLNGETPSRDSVVKAVRSGHVIAACGFDAADVTCDGQIPGGEVRKSASMKLHVTAAMAENYGNIKEIRIYADDRIIHRELLDLNKVDMDFTVSGMDARYFIRVEIAAENEHRLAVPTPFYFQRG